MNLKHLESFVRVAELGSFSKAARVLDIAQPALSRQVRSLETDLRETLLLRNGRGVTLTDAGRRLFEHGVQILQRVSQAREDLGAQRDAAVGHVTIGLPPSIGRRLTLPLIESFREHLPRARLTIVEGLSANIAEWIASGRADLGLLYNPDAQPALEITPLLHERLCLVEAVRGRKGSRGAGTAARAGRVPVDPARAPSGDSPVAADAGQSGRGEAARGVGGVERAGDHRPGVRPRGLRGAQCERGRCIGPRQRTGACGRSSSPNC